MRESLVGFVVGLAAFTGLLVETSKGEGEKASGDASSGTVVGKVEWRGDPVERRPLEITKDKETCGHAEPILSESLLVDPESRGIQNVVVSIRGIVGGKELDRSRPLELSQKGCRFEPHVLLVPVESKVTVTNGDPLSHNVTAVAFENDPMNKLQPAGSGSIEYEVFDPERIRIKCEIHPWMSATLVVIEHPYYAVTDAAGSFRIPDVPAGTHELLLWHETLGEAELSVTVPAGGEVSVAHAFGPGS